MYDKSLLTAVRAAFFAMLLLTASTLPAAGQAPESLRDWKQLANKMVDSEIVAAGVTNERVIKAVRETPRHEFVPLNERENAYLDMALPIGEQQTISPPFIVAYMTQDDRSASRPTRVLEIGTGSGYQAAVLSPLVKDVYTIEIVDALGKKRAVVPQAARLQQRPRQSRRRLPGLAGACPLRQDHRHLLAGEGAAAARRSAPGRRPDDYPRRRALPAEPLPLSQNGRRAEVRSYSSPRSSCR